MYYTLRRKVTKDIKKWLNFSTILVLIQVILGILTVIYVQGKIPLFLGVSHQLVGLLYFISLLFLYYSLRINKA
jgi:cytochrome c oxidase assembly protein subunit 15